MVQEMRGLHEKLQIEIQETFADFLGSVSKDPAKNTGSATTHICPPHLSFVHSSSAVLRVKIQTGQ